ncbi:hypothetical protein ACMA110817_31460 [Achromobacter marplatensis]
MGARHGVDDAQVHAQRAAGIAQHAARPVGNDHRGQRGALPAVFPVDVLDDLFAALVFEVHVDVGGLVAFLADEAFEQVVAAHRVHRGNAQAIADGGVGGRPAALAQDAFVARIQDDVVDGQEIGFVVQVGDQAEFLFDLFGHQVRDTGGKAAGRARQRFLAQVGGRRVAARHDFVGVFVVQFVQRKCATAGHRQRLRQCLGRVQRGQPHAGAQMLFGVAGQFVSALGNGLPGADAGQRVVQGLARPHVHLHLADGHHRQIRRAGGAFDGGAVQIVARLVQQVQADPGAVRKDTRQPAGLFSQAVGVDAVGGRQDGQAFGQLAQMRIALGRIGQVFRRQPVFALGCAGTGQCDEFGQVAVALAGLCQQGQAQRRGVRGGA